MENKIQFVCLSIVKSIGTSYIQLFPVLNKLYAEFYKSLHLKYSRFIPTILREISQLSGVERLTWKGTAVNFDDSYVMTGVKEIKMDVISENLTKTFPNIERVSVKKADSAKVFDIIKHSIKLKELRIGKLENTLNCGELDSACCQFETKKVTFYLDAAAFLKAEWTNKKRELKFIRIKRYESWPYDF